MSRIGSPGEERETTALFAVLGDPVSHSLSPTMMGAAFESDGVDATYVALRVRPSDLPAAVHGLRALGFAGANVTVPHKEAVLTLVDEVTEEAAAIGAVNTIAVSDDRRLLGHNTDAAGFGQALVECGFALPGARAIVVGAGGSARAVGAALAEGGAAEITVVSRNAERAREMIGCLAAHFRAPRWSSTPLEHAGRVLPGVELLVHCTPAGMSTGPSPLALPLEVMRPGSFVFDLVYRPRETALLARARSLGLQTQDGLSMLLHQGAAAYSIWTGRHAPIAAMQAALGRALALPG